MRFRLITTIIILFLFMYTQLATAGVDSWNGPLRYSNLPDGTISFTASNAAALECQLDDSSSLPCTSPFNFNGLGNGVHMLTVSAIDLLGNRSPSSYTWMISTNLLASSEVLLPQTGQTACYDVVGASIDCAGTGQDGDSQAGMLWPNQRFTDNGNGTITDKLTGLMWTKNGNHGSVTWQQALAYIATLNSQNHLGFNDWRLPNTNELESLTNKGQPLYTWLNGQGFSNIQVAYWSSTSYANSPKYALTVGMVGTIGIKDKTNSQYGNILPVRTGQASLAMASAPPQTGQTSCYDTAGNSVACAGTGQDGDIKAGAVWPTPRFVDNSIANNVDLTVTDRLTGLVWAKDANLMKTRDPLFDQDYDSTALAEKNNDGAVTWQHALDYIAKLNSENFLGYNDWRLPNIKELANLPNAEVGNSTIWLNAQGFSNTQMYYWSSTTSLPFLLGTLNPAWTAGVYNGSIDSAIAKTPTSTVWHVWPVRSGQNGALTATLSHFSPAKDLRVNQSTYLLKGSVSTSATPVTVRVDFEGQVYYPAVTNGTFEQLLSFSTEKTYVVSVVATDQLGNRDTIQRSISYGPTANDYSIYYDSATLACNAPISIASTTSCSTTNGTYSCQITLAVASAAQFSECRIIPAAGSTFTNASGCSGAYSGSDFVTGAITASSCSIRGTLAGALKQFTITGSVADNNGTVSCTSPVYAGSTSTCSISPSTGYVLSSLTDNGSSVIASVSNGIYKIGGNSLLTSGINSNHDVVATFAPIINGTCGASNGSSFNTNPTVDLCSMGTATTAIGTGPWNWTCKGTNGGSTASCNASIQTYSVIFIAGTNGSLTGQTNQTVNYNSNSAVVTAVPTIGHHFVNWTDANGQIISIANPLIVSSVTSNQTITANFSIDIFTVTPVTSASYSVAPSVTQVVSYNSKTTLTITPANGYGIASVTGCNGTLTGTTYTTGAITTSCSISVTAVARSASTTGTLPTMNDALKTLQAVSGVTTLSAADKIRYDVAPLNSSGQPTGNGTVDLADVIMILRRSIGIGSW